MKKKKKRKKKERKKKKNKKKVNPLQRRGFEGLDCWDLTFCLLWFPVNIDRSSCSFLAIPWGTIQTTDTKAAYTAQIMKFFSYEIAYLSLEVFHVPRSLKNRSSYDLTIVQLDALKPINHSKKWLRMPLI